MRFMMVISWREKSEMPKRPIGKGKTFTIGRFFMNMFINHALYLYILRTCIAIHLWCAMHMLFEYLRKITAVFKTTF